MRVSLRIYKYLLFALALAVLGCGGSKSSSGSNDVVGGDATNGGDTVDATPDVDLGSHTAAALCGPAGCTISSSDGRLQLVVPPDALESDVVLFIDEIAEADRPASPFTPRGRTITIGPADQTFKKTVQVVIKSDGTKWFNPYLQHYDATTTTWTKLERDAQPTLPSDPIFTVSAQTSTLGIFTVADERFLSPQWMALTDTHLFVSNAAVTLDASFNTTYHEAWITIVDRTTSEVVKLIRTTQLNPNNLLIRDQKLYVVNAGSYEFDSSFAPLSTSDGGLDVFDLSVDPTTWTTPQFNIKIPSTTSGHRGAPGVIAILSDGKTAFLGSNVAPELFEIDLDTKSIRSVVVLPKLSGDSPSYTARPYLRGSDDMLYVGLPDEDRVILVNPLDAQVQPDMYSVKSKTGDNPARPDFLEPNAPTGIFALNTVGQTLSVIDLAQKSVTDDVLELGLYPNVLRINGSSAYVVVSGDHALAQFIATKPEPSTLVAAYLTFPEGSNPFDLVISVDGSLGFVSDQVRNRVYAVKLGSAPELLSEIE